MPEGEKPTKPTKTENLGKIGGIEKMPTLARKKMKMNEMMKNLGRELP